MATTTPDTTTSAGNAMDAHTSCDASWDPLESGPMATTTPDTNTSAGNAMDASRDAHTSCDASCDALAFGPMATTPDTANAVASASVVRRRRCLDSYAEHFGVESLPRAR